MDSIQLTLNTNPDTSPSCSGSLDSLDTDTLTMEAMEESLSFSSDIKSNIKGMKRNTYNNIPRDPHACYFNICKNPAQKDTSVECP